MPRLRLVLETQRKNLRFTQYDLDVVLTPFEHVATLVDAFDQQKATIAADPHLTDDGKKAALAKARATTREAVKAWQEPRLKGIDADLLAQRAALIPQADVPDQHRVSLMASELLKFTPQDRAILYNQATEDERRVMEAASAATGRVPFKSANGLELKPLLDPKTVDESILARAATANPTAAQKVQELMEIRQLTDSVAGVALAEIG
jgi:hypothetical protein